MELILKVKHVGAQAGTVGWLCENADAIAIRMCCGRRCAFLTNHYGRELFILVDSDPYGTHDGSVMVKRHELYGPEPTLNMTVTDACWDAIQEIAEKAVDILESDVETPITVLVSI